MFVEDLSPFFNVAEFGTAASAYDAYGQAVDLVGIFDSGYSQGAVGDYGMAATQPTYTMQTGAIPSDPVGWTLTINSASYIVSAHEPDGTGMSRLILGMA